MAARPLHLLHVFPSFEIGGAQVRFCRLVAALAADGGPAFRHTVLALNGDYACADRLPAGAPVALANWRPEKANILAARKAAARRLAEIRPDRLLTYNWGAIEWALANTPVRIPHLHVEDGFGPDEAERSPVRRRILRWLALRDKQVLVPSSALVRRAIGAWGLHRQVRLVPNGIDLPRPEQAGDDDLATRIAGLDGGQGPGSGPVIGTIARLSAIKRLDRLVRAGAALPAAWSCRLVIVGDGPERGNLQRLVDDLGLGSRVLLPGAHPAPAAVMPLFDLFALSSDSEQMPTSVLEAMAAGLPVVATDVGDVCAMLAAENRPWLSPACNVAFANALQAALSEPARWAVLGAANRIKVENDYTTAAMAASWREMIG